MTYDKLSISLELPPLDAYGALTVVDALEAVIKALWHTHGDHMEDIIARDRGDTERPPDSVWSGNPNADGNTDIDF